jgi:carbonic anhydrase
MIQHNEYQDLLKNNRHWAAQKLKTDPEYFEELAKPQNPKFLFIGCSDSRVPIDLVTHSEPGELFVHRNIANQVNLTDINILAIVEYAVEILRIEHIIILGHYNCGGIKAAVEGLDQEEIVENWISQISDLYYNNRKELEAIGDERKMMDMLSELNIIAQMKNLLHTPVIHRAFKKGRKLNFHGWVFDIYTGLIKDIVLPVNDWKEAKLLPEDYGTWQTST